MRTNTRGLFVGAVVAGLILSAGRVQGGFIPYTNDLPGFLAAAGTTTTETFNSGTPANYAAPNGPVAASGSFGPLTVTGTASNGYVGLAPAGAGVSGTVNNSQFIYLSGTNQQTGGVSIGAVNGSPTATFTLSSAQKAFGFDWTDTDADDQYRITLNGGTTTGGQVYTYSPVGTGSGFFGVTTTGTDTFTSVTFSKATTGSSLDTFGIDNVRFAAVNAVTAVATPAPAGVFVLAAAACLLGVMRRVRLAAI